MLALLSLRSRIKVRSRTQTDSLALQMTEADIEQRILQAEAAVATAQAAYAGADEGSRTLCGQLLLAEEKALERLWKQQLLPQRAAGHTQVGACCLAIAPVPQATAFAYDSTLELLLRLRRQ